MTQGAFLNMRRGATWSSLIPYTTLFQSVGAQSVVNNSGTFEKTGGTGTSNLNTLVFNNLAGGTVAANSGTWEFTLGATVSNGGGTCTGSWTVGWGVSWTLDAGTYALNGT